MNALNGQRIASTAAGNVSFDDAERIFLRHHYEQVDQPMPLSYDKKNPLMTSAEILLGSEDAARELDGDLTESLAFSGIDRRHLLTGEGYLPLHRVIDFLNHAAESLGCDNFGLLVAKHQPPARFAMMGQLIRFSPTLGDAIVDAIRFAILNSQYSSWNIQQSGQAMTLRRQTRATYDADISQLQTLALALVHKAIRAICQRRVTVSQVTFSHREPADVKQVQAFFEAPVLYDQPSTAIVLPVSELAIRIPTADEQVHRLLVAHLESLAGATTTELDTVERLRLELRQTVGSRRCTLEGVSQAWGVHPRGLQRQLRELGTSFRDLLCDVRQELAEEYLRNSSIPVLELADILGYRNASAFSRAFKQRTGVAPDHWRGKQAGREAVAK